MRAPAQSGSSAAVYVRGVLLAARRRLRPLTLLGHDSTTHVLAVVDGVEGKLMRSLQAVAA